LIDLAFNGWRIKQKRRDHALLLDIADSIEHHGWRTFFVDEFHALDRKANNITSRQMQAAWARELEEFACKHIFHNEVGGKALLHVLTTHKWLSGTDCIDCVRLHYLLARQKWPYQSTQEKLAAENHYRTAIDLATSHDDPVADWWRLEAETRLASLLFDLETVRRGLLSDPDRLTSNADARVPEDLRAEGLRILHRLMEDTRAKWGFGSARHLQTVETYTASLLRPFAAVTTEQLREVDELIHKVLSDCVFSKLEETAEREPDNWVYQPHILIQPDLDGSTPAPYRYDFLNLAAEIAQWSDRLDEAEAYLREAYAEARTVPGDSRFDRSRLESILNKLERFFTDNKRGSQAEREKIQHQLHRLYQAEHNEQPHLSRLGLLPSLE